MFYLPNQRKIDLEGVIEGMGDIRPIKYYLDSVTGDVGGVENLQHRKKFKDEKRYFEIPKISAFIHLGILKEFINEMLIGDPEGKRLVAKLTSVIKSKKTYEHVFSECEKILESDSFGWVHGWKQWQGDSIFDDARIWLMNLSIPIEEQWEGDDDCELCQTMENGSHSVKDFFEAMAKEKTKGTVVGLEENIPEQIAEEYYDAMENINIGYTKEARKILNKLLRLRPRYVPAYECLSYSYRDEGNTKKEEEYARLAYEETIKKFPDWQKMLIWGMTEHRPYMRSILGMATLLHSKGEKIEAEKLYKGLLKANPNDNQGARFLLAAMYADLLPSVVDDWTEEGNELQNWEKVDSLLARQNKKHKFWKEPK